jgi:hypothetical protein
MNHFGLETLPKFNGGTYYFDDSSKARSLFDTARELLDDASALKFSDFRATVLPTKLYIR